jgi:hypothetical protein
MHSAYRSKSNSESAISRPCFGGAATIANCNSLKA